MKLKLFFKKDKFKYKILSIDGGGLKGYFAAYAIWRLKKDFDIDIVKEFDIFAGTSTGSILVTGLLIGVNFKDILDIYEKGEAFFVKNNIVKKINAPYLPKYSNKELKKSLRDYFGNYNFEDIYNFSKKELIIYSTNMSKSRHAIFSTPNLANKSIAFESPKVMLEDAILASVSAPTYFPVWEIKDKTKNNEKNIYIDGGVWVNNPALLTYSIIKKRYNLDDKKIKLLSFGYRHDRNGKKVRKVEHDDFSKKDKDFVSISNLIETSLNLSSYLHEYVLETNLEKNQYMRCTVDTHKNFEMDSLTEEYKQLARDAYENKKEELKEFILRK